MALTVCPECNANVSSFAVACPHCGYPVKEQEIAPQKRKRRRANGEGSIYERVRGSGKYIATIDKFTDGQRRQHVYLGTFPSVERAQKAIDEYHAVHSSVLSSNMTLHELFSVFEKCLKEEEYKTYESRSKRYESALKCIGAFKDIQINLLNNENLFAVLENPSYSFYQKKYIKLLFNDLLAFGRKRGAIPENFALEENGEQVIRVNTEESAEIELGKVDKMKGVEFERWFSDLLKKKGYYNVRITDVSGDQGVDVTAEKDEIRFAFQCKRHSKPISNTAIQEVATGRKIYDCHVGIVATNSVFSEGAIVAAKAMNVILWDRNKLKMFIEECLV